MKILVLKYLTEIFFHFQNFWEFDVFEFHFYFYSFGGTYFFMFITLFIAPFLHVSRPLPEASGIFLACLL